MKQHIMVMELICRFTCCNTTPGPAFFIADPFSLCISFLFSRAKRMDKEYCHVQEHISLLFDKEFAEGKLFVLYIYDSF